MQRRVTFGAVKARLYDAPGATKVTVVGEGRETLAPSSAELSQNPKSSFSDLQLQELVPSLNQVTRDERTTRGS